MHARRIATLTAAVCLSMGRVALRPAAHRQARAGDVTEARVLAEASAGTNWLVEGRTFDQQHFSPLSQINDTNISHLGLAWALDIDSPMGLVSEPIVVDGVIYLSAPHSRVYAVEAATAKVLWTFDPHVRIDRLGNSWSAQTNRGVAVWAGKVYVGTGDCRLVAIDAASGTKLWESRVCDETQTGIIGAPRVGQGKVLIGYNGSDWGVRGSVPAFDTETGRELWRFWTVPGDPAKGFESGALELAAKTWSGDRWWRIGGGDVWDAITYDPVTGLVFLATAGANPGFTFGDLATLKVDGDRLFSGCIVAVHADTGEYAWHDQTSPLTENMHVLIADLTIEGAVRRVAMTVPKNGIFYVLDARTGQRVTEKALSTERSAGHNWWPMSYSPITGLVYVPMRDRRTRAPAPGETRTGGRLFAWDPVRQTARWTVEQPFSINGGVLATAGNLVFEGEGTGEFAAYAADTGRKVWSFMTGSAIDSTPVTFAEHDVQYILVPVGWGSASRLFARGSSMATPESKRGPSRLLAFKLGATSQLPAMQREIPPVPRPPEEPVSKRMIRRGQALYQQFLCSQCHAPEADGSGAWTVNGATPDLRYMPPDAHDRWEAVVLGGSHRDKGMPGFSTPPGFPLVSRSMTRAEAEAIHAYVVHQAWKAYDREQRALNAKKR